MCREQTFNDFRINDLNSLNGYVSLPGVLGVLVTHSSGQMSSRLCAALAALLLGASVRVAESRPILLAWFVRLSH